MGGPKMDKKWLRRFLDLGHDAGVEGISPREIERQEETVLRALEILEERPGVILADEVGMGKTFEAIAVMACFIERGIKGKILVITPGPELNNHWVSVMDRFTERGFYNFNRGQYLAISRISELPKAAKKKNVKIIFAPMNILITVRGIEEKKFLLNAYFRWAKLSHEKRKKISRYYFGTENKVADVTKLSPYMGMWKYRELKNVFEEAFCRSVTKGGFRPQGFEGLADIYTRSREKGFKDKERVGKALSRARFKIVNGKIPRFSLLILDEAHKLKNPWTVRSQGFDTILFDKFDKALFLTATPFQLGVHELYQVFKLFSYAKLRPEERQALMDQVQRLREKIEEYQQAYRRLEETWYSIDVERAERFEDWYEEFPDLDGPDTGSPEINELARLLKQLLLTKREYIEPEFRNWMIRSLKEDKYEYRNPLRVEVPDRNNSLPFLVHERLVFELYRSRSQTFKAAVDINMTSSFQAAQNGAIVSLKGGSRQTDLKEYRELLRKLLGLKIVMRNHPKVSYVVEKTVALLIAGEKTLIFCERVHTAQAIKEQCEAYWKKHIDSLWREALPGADGAAIRQAQKTRQKQFTTATSGYSVLLNENYVPALFKNSTFIRSHKKQILELANSILEELRLTGTSVKRVNYKIAKRCLEHSALRFVQEQHPSLLGRLHGQRKELAERIIDRSYLTDGIDSRFETAGSVAWTGGPGKKPEWKISQHLLNIILTTSYRGIWYSMRDELGKLPPEDRLQFVEAVKSFLTKQLVEFLPQLLARARQGRRNRLNDIRMALDQWWNEEECQWRERTEQLLQQCINSNESKRNSILEYGLLSSSPVRHTLDASAREGLKEGFNTPFYPMVLICNTPMQEGLDLHKECTRLIHHDLCWNPAQLEQRTGRLDRIGSKISRVRERDYSAMLELCFPLIPGTIDVRQYDVVKEREKWLEFLLGRPPEFDYDPMEEVELRQLPEGLREALTINLGPSSS